MCARNFHSYTHLVLALGIVREPTVRGFMNILLHTSHWPGDPPPLGNIALTSSVTIYFEQFSCGAEIIFV